MNQRKDAPIGVFDSGVGGLTVAREIMRNLPHERIVYFGDTARVPYGSKSRETVIRYSRQIVRFLKTQEVKAIVVACNTASALALETIQQETDIPMLGVVEPGARVAAKTTRNKKIGLIGTRATVKSDLYRTMIQKTDPQKVIDQTPKLMRRSKLPIVKAKIGPKIMTLVADESIYDLIPVKKEVKADVSGIYIIGVRGLRGALTPPAKKKGWFARMKDKAVNMSKGK